MAAADIGSPLRALLRIAAYGGLTLACMPLQAFALVLRLRLRTTLPLWYHRQSCRILGFRVERVGRRARARPTLYVANHVSYFDIAVLGSLIKGSFVAKAEVARWPFFGWLAKLQRSVFVERRGVRSADHRDGMGERLEAGDSLILFPEGTSGDGNRVLPFKSALLSVAERRPRGKPLIVQPVSIAYTRLDGMPMGRYLRPNFAWYGDMDLAGHMWHALGLGWVTVVVQFHDPVTIEDFGSRKALRDHCEAAVAAGVADALAGRVGAAKRPKAGAAGRLRERVGTAVRGTDLPGMDRGARGAS